MNLSKISSLAVVALALLSCGKDEETGAGAVCGDGIVQAPEQCDDGNDVEDDGCSSNCQLRRCGDGMVQTGEQCDDGNLSEVDGCTTLCRLPACGDGFKQDGEICDDGNVDDGDSCLNNCELASCGDGIVHLGVEACDDGNSDDGDGCTSDCMLSSCGDGIIQPPEQCDDGNADDTDECLSTCQPPFCGDGFVHAGVEQCDDGNADDHDGCTNACALASCGDGITQPPEQCDDGNADDTDECLSTCQLPFCGDGWVHAGVEQCDDGNGFDTDGCLTSCQEAFCGDGAVWAGHEACDDGNGINDDGCSNLCALPTCGDAIVQQDEECDDGNADNTDGCLLTCQQLDLCEGFAITGVLPPVGCVGASPPQLQLVASGLGFLVVEGQPPEVLFDGAPVPILNLLGCQPIEGALNNIESCSGMEIDIPDALPAGTYSIEVTNPITQPCTATASLSVTFAPTLTSVVPNVVCAAAPVSFALGGSNFAPTTQVSLGGNIPPLSTTFVDANNMIASFGPLSAGVYDMTVSNGPACQDTLIGAVTVLPKPMVYFVDPPVAYNGINIQVTIYASGINGGNVVDVGIRPAGSNQPYQPLVFTYDPLKPNRIQAVVPLLLAAGYYDVKVEDAINCIAELPAGLQVVDDSALTVALDRVVPSFGYTAAKTGVTLYAVDPLPPGKTGFSPVPSVYLNPSNPGPNDLAAPLSAVAYVNWDRTTGVVPAGLPVGDYDVIAINPDGSVGVLITPNGFTVTATPPPVIDSISPGSVPNNGPQKVMLYGSGFNGPTVELLCEGVANPYQVTVNTASSDTLDVTVPANLLPQGAACIFRVTNPDGSIGEYSALGVTNPAENIGPLVLGPSMGVARRAPAVVVGNATSSARFMYVIGGDNGASNGAFDSIEAVPLDAYGQLGSWRTLPGLLPEARTLAAVAVIGRHLFLVGGNDGASAISSVRRAEILDPADAPTITDLSLELAPGGLTQGVWYYKISAVMGPGDLDNPLGETLPSDPQAVQVPAGLTQPLEVTLFWSAVPGAVDYRVYRSPVAGVGVGNEELLAVVAAPTIQYLDGGAATNPSALPLQIGDLGVWKAMPPLQHPREGLGLAQALDPLSGSSWYLYALAGRDDTATALASYEYLPVDASTEHPPGAALWTEDLGNPLAAPRWQLGAYLVDEVATDRVPSGDTWIYAGGGVDSSGAGQQPDLDAALVQAGGALGGWIAVANPGSFAGYGTAAAANQLFIFGGQGAAVSNAVRSAQICGIGYNCTNTPNLKNWNAAGIALQIPRYLHGSAVGSARIFLVGGLSTGNVPTATVESVVW